MKKIRLIRTMIMEFEPDPKYYPEGATIEQMAEIEANVDDRESLFSGDIKSDEVKFEIID